MKYIVDEQKLQQLATMIASKVKCGDVYLLEGDLGSGKTTFTKYLFAALGVKEHVSSPTFVIMKSYQGQLPLFHIDAYRLNQLEDLGFDELLFNGAVIIEWPSLIKSFWEKAYKISFSYIDELRREVEIDDELIN